MSQWAMSTITSAPTSSAILGAAKLTGRTQRGLSVGLLDAVTERVDGAGLLGDEAAVTRLLGPSPGADELVKALAGAAKGGHAALCRRLLAAGAPVDGAIALVKGSDETIELLRSLS